jgi:hypothetical protein
MHCKYAAEADMFMKKFRDQAAQEGNSENEEEEKVVEAMGERFNGDGGPVRSHFKRIRTRRSAKSQEEAARFGPFDIDRVNTRDSFGRTQS